MIKVNNTDLGYTTRRSALAQSWLTLLAVVIYTMRLCFMLEAYITLHNQVYASCDFTREFMHAHVQHALIDVANSITIDITSTPSTESPQILSPESCS